MMLIKNIIPVFGHGWLGPEGPFEIPDKFRLEVDEGALKIIEGGMVGQCVEVGHIFNGMSVLLIRRILNNYDVLLRLEQFSKDDLLNISHRMPKKLLYTGSVILEE